MGRYWPVVAIVVVFGGIGLAGALKPSRGHSADAAEAQARLDALPMTLGAWTAATNAIPPKHLQIAEAQAHLSRTYTNPATRSAVSVMLLYGEPGPLGAHTPETCYVGAGYRQLGAATTRDLAGSSLWATNFETATPPTVTLSVSWGWGTGADWKASENPRFDFAAHSRIYKLYVSAVLPPGPAGTRGPADDFAAALLAELRTRLAPETSPPTAGGQP